MIRPLRRVHRGVFVVLAAVLLAAVLRAMSAEPWTPRVGRAPAALLEGSARDASR